MSNSMPFLPPVLATVNELVTSKTIPALDGDQMTALSEYLFRSADNPLRIKVAEVAYSNREHPNALSLFLAATMPLAQKWSDRKAERFFVYPSAWQVECMYNGAVNALIGIFHRPVILHSIRDSFRRYLYRSMLKGACGEYFRRDENSGIHTVENVDKFSSHNSTTRTAEEELVTRDLLEQIAQYPLLRRGLSKTLECIVELGPDLALRENVTPENWKNMRGVRPMLDAEAIAQASGIKRDLVLHNLSLARAVIRKAFNGDGRLFVTR
ncbi:MAG TPA: hypothetical protein VHA33_23660 [Candidatus Angelobacter sp.]|jgi:hypothetical protein|nr:hypothetical protein [Candidatus Angelobacter sp.]